MLLYIYIAITSSLQKGALRFPPSCNVAAHAGLFFSFLCMPSICLFLFSSSSFPSMPLLRSNENKFKKRKSREGGLHNSTATKEKRKLYGGNRAGQRHPFHTVTDFCFVGQQQQQHTGFEKPPKFAQWNAQLGPSIAVSLRTSWWSSTSSSASFHDSTRARSSTSQRHLAALRRWRWS